MTTKPAELTFAVGVYDGSAARDQLDAVRTMYAEVYAEPPYFEGPDDVEWFARDWPRRPSRARRRPRPGGPRSRSTGTPSRWRSNTSPAAWRRSAR